MCAQDRSSLWKSRRGSFAAGAQRHALLALSLLVSAALLLAAGGAFSRRVGAGGNGDLRDAVPLPDGRVVFSGPAAGAPEADGGRSLFACAPDGTQMKRITFGPGIDSKPRLLPDGRVAFERRRPAGDAAEWMVVNPDGTGLVRFHGQAPPQGLDLSAAGARPRALTSVVDASKDSGRLLCLDVRVSRLPSVARLAPGGVEKVRVYTGGDGSARQGAGAAGALPGLLGEAPVEPDGSFFLEVPADTPLRLEIVGRGGRRLALCDGGLWVRPNESRACIGCHEDPDLAPENRLPLAVRKSAVRLAPSAGGMPAAEVQE